MLSLLLLLLLSLLLQRRTEACRTQFEAFDAARKALLTQQANATESARV